MSGDGSLSYVDVGLAWGEPLTEGEHRFVHQWVLVDHVRAWAWRQVPLALEARGRLVIVGTVGLVQLGEG